MSKVSPGLAAVCAAAKVAYWPGEGLLLFTTFTAALAEVLSEMQAIAASVKIFFIA